MKNVDVIISKDYRFSMTLLINIRKMLDIKVSKNETKDNVITFKVRDGMSIIKTNEFEYLFVTICDDGTVINRCSAKFTQEDDVVNLQFIVIEELELQRYPS